MERPKSRSLSPNRVLINGQMIGNQDSDSSFERKRILLDNIVEESDPFLSESDRNGSDLENVVMAADQNVRHFFSGVDQDNAKELEAICKSSQKELRVLSNVLSVMDDTAKNLIVETLVKIYKKEIMNRLTQLPERGHSLSTDYNSDTVKTTSSSQSIKVVISSECKYMRPASKLVQFDDSWKQQGAIKDGLKKSLRSKPKGVSKQQKKLERETVNFNADFSLEKVIESNFDGRKFTKNKSETEYRFTKNEVLNKLLRYPLEKPIAQTERFLVQTPAEKTSSPTKPKCNEPCRKKWKNPTFGVKQLTSEGVQACVSSKRKVRHYKKPSVEYLKRFRYPKESVSDMAITCPFGCLLRLKKSQSDVQLKKAKLPNNSEVPSASFIAVDRKCSNELLLATDMRRKNQLIRYLDKDLKRGDSSIQFSQILFETANKNMDSEVSFVEIPTIDQTQVNNFNANYLLHSVRIVPQGKSPVEPFATSLNNISITDEEYRRWLKKQNYFKYSKAPSIEDLRSISERVTYVKRPEGSERRRVCGMLKDCADAEEPSNSDRYSAYMEWFGDVFLYEHVVVSRAMNFFLSLHMKRTRVLSKWDRCVQALFLAVFFGVWYYFSQYVYIEPTKKNSGRLWK